MLVPAIEDVHGPFRSNAFEARYPYHNPYLQPISLQLEPGPEQHPKDAGWSITPAEAAWQRNTTSPSTQPQTFALIKIDLGTCYFFIPLNRLLHSLYIWSVGYKNGHIIGIRRNLCPKTAGKGDSTQGWICRPIPEPTEQGLQNEDIEKKRQGATMPDQVLDSKRLQMLTVHLDYRLRIVVHHADPFVELWFESGGFRNRRRKPMVNPVKGLVRSDLNWSAWL